MTKVLSIDIEKLSKPSNLIDIKKIISVYYHEFTKSYYFEGEKHDFWEFVYVDKGEVTVSGEGTFYSLTQGNVIFHKPNEFHTISGNGLEPSNVLVTSFISSSKSMSFFENKIIHLNEKEIQFLREYVSESKLVYKKQLGLIYKDEHKLKRSYTGSEQMMYLLLQQFLISLIRYESESITHDFNFSLLGKKYKDPLINNVIAFLTNHIAEKIYLDDICQHFFLSKTHLKKHFKKHTDFTVMEYLRLLRINKAKQLIRKKEYTFTEISEFTGYNSVHHFSNSFKLFTGMTPSEYENSINSK